MKAVVATALEHEGAERVAYVDEACAGDAELRLEVESLLAASDGTGGVLARPAVDAVDLAAFGGSADSNLLVRLAAALGDRYEIERELGGGGMARVFLATERALGRHVVIKVLPVEMTAGLSVERFKREIAFAARLQHANIVPLLSAGEVDGLPYYTMPFVEGLSLRTRLQREGALESRDAVAVLRDVARALAYAHDHGVVHRDVKPDNVLIAGGAAVVTDFGIAKALSAARTASAPPAEVGPGSTITQLGTVLGTPAYMPPEQAAGDEGVDHRADIYALGCTAYELVTGRPPFHGRPTQQLIAAHLTEQPVPIAGARGPMPPALAELIMRCLAKEPQARPSASDIARMLDGELTLPPESGTESRDRGDRTSPRRRAAVVLTIGLMILVAAPLIGRLRDQFGSAADAPRTVAVLPLDNVGGDTTNAFFAAGLTDELTNALAQIEGLRVTAPGTLVDDNAIATPELARKLGVSALLAGSVQPERERLRVRVRLISGSDGHVMWSKVYNKTRSDVLVVQTDIADSVAASLRLTLSPSAQARVAGASGTRDADAYLVYLQGRYAAARYTEPDLRRSIALYAQAIDRDSTFARAWAGTADAWASLAGDFVAPNEALPPAREAARRALAIDSTLAEGHIALGNVLLSDWDAEGAAAAFRRAVALEPSSATTHYYLASALIALGRFDEALNHATTAHRLEPTQPAYATAVALVRLREGQLDSAAAAARAAYALDSTFTYATTVLGDALRLKGAPREALDVYASRGPAQTAYDLVGPALARIALEQPEEARLTIREITGLGTRQNVPADAVAMIHAHLGDREQAFAWLERAYVSHAAALISLATDQDWSPLRDDPRFAALVARVARR